MIKTVHRRVEFSSEDIKKALIEWLRSMDEQYPDDGATTFGFDLNEDGAALSWSVSITDRP